MSPVRDRRLIYVKLPTRRLLAKSARRGTGSVTRPADQGGV